MIKICDRICRAYLVPVYSFGENNLYSQMTSDRARRFQDWFTDKFGFSPPMFYGRGLFQYSFGILPYREQVTTVGMWKLLTFSRYYTSTCRSSWNQNFLSYNYKAPFLHIWVISTCIYIHILRHTLAYCVVCWVGIKAMEAVLYQLKGR